MPGVISCFSATISTAIAKTWPICGEIEAAGGDEPGYQPRSSKPVHSGDLGRSRFGRTDAGEEYPKKARIATGVSRFFRCSPRFALVAGGRGLRWPGPLWTTGQRVQLILLDTRYFRSPLKTGSQPGRTGLKDIVGYDARTTIRRAYDPGDGAVGKWLSRPASDAWLNSAGRSVRACR